MIKHLSAIHLTIVKINKGALIWLMQILIYYSPFILPDRYGENLNIYSFIQLIGFIIIC